MSQGMSDLRKLPLPRFLNFVRWWATRNIEDQADLDRFEQKLWMPPVGVVVTKGPWSADAETAAFSAAKAAFGK